MRAILTYHSIDASGSVISLAPAVFRAHVDWLASGAVRVVDVAELASLPDPIDAVALAFDDAFANFESDAFPLLREHGFPSALFVVTGHVGGDNRWRGAGNDGIPALRLLDWDALARLQSAGVSIGAHTRSHGRLPALSDHELDDELAGSRADLEQRLGRRPELFAYPYGAVDVRVARAVARHYRFACTTEFRALGAGDAPALLPRLDAWYFQDPARLRHWGTPAFRAWVWTRRQGRTARTFLTRARGGAA